MLKDKRTSIILWAGPSEVPSTKVAQFLSSMSSVYIFFSWEAPYDKTKRIACAPSEDLLAWDLSNMKSPH